MCYILAQSAPGGSHVCSLPARLSAIVLCLGLFLLFALSAEAESIDFDVAGGHFYKQANGQGGEGEGGYAITNDSGVPFWDAFQAYGGPTALGYPVTGRFVYDGFVTQAMQKAVFQWRPDVGQVYFLNTFDALHDKGKDDWLEAYRQTPKPFDTGPDAGLSWEGVVARHLSFLDQNASIKGVFLSDPDWLNHYGLPVSYADEGNSFVVRAQRATFQYWKEDVPWAKAGEVSVANGGDLAKEAGLWPAEGVNAMLSSGAAATAPIRPAQGHDWRSPGFVSVVGGTIYDPSGVRLESAGTNLPNIPFRAGLDENLDWMRQHHLRWMRVFATGHNAGPDRTPRSAAEAIAALTHLLDKVNAFNAAHDLSEAIYVLVSLTDYYPPGVPGDRFAYDHPTFTLSPVLPAPWFRAGIRSFDFDQEHNYGKLYGMPNYEVYYKPWVQQVVSALSGSRYLMGWQFGNELKARGSPRNGITSGQAYDWYLDFTRDMVDTIRAADQNHLIFTGSQYIAEEVDWEYRPKGLPVADRVPEYRRLVQRMLDVRGSYTWNVWSVTSYDFNPYPLDDAMLFGKAGVAVVATEYGFTRGTPDEMQSRYGGDQATAVRNGLDRPWQTLDGQTQPRQWSVPELFAKGVLDGVAPWGSPAPGTDCGMDMDSQRGITGAPDEGPLWEAWAQSAATLEAANGAAGSWK